MEKKEIIGYLKNHFRYYTMNSRNLTTSYARNMKIYNVVPPKYLKKAYELLETDEVFEEINLLLAKFEQKYNYQYQAGFNGRSGGYLVLYQGGKNENGQIYTTPGMDLDQDEDFEDWSIDELKARYYLVKDFDKLADDIIKTFIHYCKNAKIQDKEYVIKKTKKVAII